MALSSWSFGVRDTSFRTVFLALPTPFDAAGELDLHSLRRVGVDAAERIAVETGAKEFSDEG